MTERWRWIGAKRRHVPKKATLLYLSAGSGGQAAGAVTATHIPDLGFRWDVSWEVKR